MENAIQKGIEAAEQDLVKDAEEKLLEEVQTLIFSTQSLASVSANSLCEMKHVRFIHLLLHPSVQLCLCVNEPFFSPGSPEASPISQFLGKLAIPSP